MYKINLSVTLAIIVLLIAGCGGASDARLVNDLKQAGMSYHLYIDAHKKGPAGWDEWIAFAKGDGADVAITRLREAKYEVTWGADLANLPGPSSETVLAKPPGKGPVLMMDGAVTR